MKNDDVCEVEGIAERVAERVVAAAAERFGAYEARKIAEDVVRKLAVVVEHRSSDPEDDAHVVVLTLGGEEISRTTFYP